ncbi:DNA-binding response regulator [Pseudomonas sp. AOB-7]|uniref:response regulator transcription factor n=1 Tax=Pseudomonas sp. AOB-7 TaxID=2482750 RepID=UPI000EFB8A90|nr:response regulator transcription factor [Pseudomonas sp. AOB-7]RMH81798.1 DNA-binding response regulator [Pseudomonas sp. AOB-7]
MHKVMIVDDHPVIRLAVRVLLERHGFAVVGEADNGVAAVQMAREQEVDVIILDIGIPKLDGLQVISRLRALGRPPRVLVLTSQLPGVVAERCLQAGAAGFVSKEEDLSGLVGAVSAVLSGYTYFPYDLIGTDVGKEAEESDGGRLARLSNRELSVLRYLARGLTNKEIADVMLLSNKTVSTYKTRLQQKLNVQTLVALIEFAKRNGVT